jgi:hypothetical protein
MIKECDNYPELNHEDCSLDPAERAIGEYFENQGLSVERICSVKHQIGTKNPDFRLVDSDGSACLCEVKAMSSSTGADTKGDWEYSYRMESKQLIEKAQESGVIPVARPEQMKLWKGEIPYPKKGRNTEGKEKEYERDLNNLLNQTPAKSLSFSVTIHRDDPFIWTDEEKVEFVNVLAKNLLLIAEGQIPRNWDIYPGFIIGDYTKKREHGRRICNTVEVRSSSDLLSLKSYSYLGINWKSIEKRSHEAQRQINNRLEDEAKPESVARLVVILLSTNLVFHYASELDKLKSEIKRRFISKLPGLSAFAFCEVAGLEGSNDVSLGSFVVFHSDNNTVPPLPDSIFNEETSSHIRQYHD